MIELIPAIDIINGECVRLTKGDYAQKTVYSTDPVEVARKFEAMGFKRLHVVDLDGAKSRHVVNALALRNISAATNLSIDFGGGIKTQADMDLVFDNGASMATVGSVSCTDPAMFESWISRYGSGRIILGADVRDDKISINGWCEDTRRDVYEFIAHYAAKGINKVLCTDISRDGALRGPSQKLYVDIMSRFPDIHLMASGGVSSAEDIMELDENGIPAVVFGKAFYEGLIDMEKIGKFLR